tara:strand:- start:191 stop:817 length:627 start_codon:yes stop_codon:yes gene_type:complete
MKILAISQRVESVEGYIEKRDCLDQRWSHLILKLGFLPFPLSNLLEPSEIIKSIAPSAIVLSGGNNIARVDESALDISKERDDFEEKLIQIAMEKNIPLLGVCRGMQMINLFFGGSISRQDDHVGAKHKITFSGKSENNPRLVNSYHKWSIKKSELGKSLIPLALADDNTIEGFYHKEYPLLGIMWHPEREEPYCIDDLNLIKKFLQL